MSFQFPIENFIFFEYLNEAFLDVNPYLLCHPYQQPKCLGIRRGFLWCNRDFGIHDLHRLTLDISIIQQRNTRLIRHRFQFKCKKQSKEVRKRFRWGSSLMKILNVLRLYMTDRAIYLHRLSVSFCNTVWAVKTGPILTAKSVENTHTHSFTWPSSIISIIDVEVRRCWWSICYVYSTEIGRSNWLATLTKDKWVL